MKAIILTRVSTEEQKEAGNSLPAQSSRLNKYAEERGLEISKEFTFDESAWKIERKKFQEVLDMLKTSEEPVALCCDKIDRLIRNFTKDLAALEELRKEGKIELHFSSDNIILNKNSQASDLFRFHIGVGLASYYSNAISDNVKRANENKIRQGEWIGKAPIGYINTENENGDKDIMIDPIKGHMIKKMFELYASGNYSFKKLQQEIHKMGLIGYLNRPISTSIIYHTISNPFYYGMMKVKGNLYPHKYPPLISKYLFDKAQSIRAGWHKKPFKYAAKPYIFRGLIKCADCGCTITPEISKGHIYYKCTNYHKKHDKVTYVKEEELLGPIKLLLKDMQISDKKISEVINGLKKINESQNHFHRQSTINFRREHDKLEARIGNLMDARFDGSITTDMFNQKLKEYKEKQQNINEKLKAYDIADEDYYITVNTVLSLAQRAYEIFEGSEIEEKRQLLNLILQNLELKGKKLQYKLKTPFDTVLLTNNCSDMLGAWDEVRIITNSISYHN